jgi:hypothetical protein
LFGQKNSLGYILGGFFSNSSGHPDMYVGTYIDWLPATTFVSTQVFMLFHTKLIKCKQISVHAWVYNFMPSYEYTGTKCHTRVVKLETNQSNLTPIVA